MTMPFCWSASLWGSGRLTRGQSEAALGHTKGSASAQKKRKKKKKKDKNYIFAKESKLNESTPCDKTLLMYRTFLCVGISRYTGKREFFVMTICAKFEVITLWDLRLNCEFQLLGRISERERHSLRKMLTSENQLIEQENKLKLSEEALVQEAEADDEGVNSADLRRDEPFDMGVKGEIMGLKMDENHDEVDIIDNQKIQLMDRDIRAYAPTLRTKKRKPGNAFLERKKKEEKRRLEEAEGGNQIAVHDFYHKGQKGECRRNFSGASQPAVDVT